MTMGTDEDVGLRCLSRGIYRHLKLDILTGLGLPLQKGRHLHHYPVSFVRPEKCLKHLLWCQIPVVRQTNSTLRSLLVEITGDAEGMTALFHSVNRGRLTGFSELMDKNNATNIFDSNNPKPCPPHLQYFA